MYIGKVSEITGASVKAIRLYHELGLLPGVKRSGKYRIFSKQDVELVTLIKQAQCVGFTLAEMKRAMGDVGSTASWAKLLTLIEQKEDEITHTILGLEEKKKRLFQHRNDITQCLSNNPHCHILK